jgi:tetratricopeptide (TPR) repeat protein
MDPIGVCQGGRVSEVTDQLGERLRAQYDRVSFAGNAAALDDGEMEIKAAEAQLALARGRFLHARFFFDHEDRPEELAQLTVAGELFREVGDVRGEAETTFWLAIYHQVIRRDEATAIPLLDRAHALAAAADDPLVMSYVVRHLGFVDLNAGRLEQARGKFEESVRLRRQIGFRPGVAAGLVALAELAAIEGDDQTARRYLDEASVIGRETGSIGVLRWIDQARVEHHLS